MTTNLVNCIRLGIVLILFMPLVVTPGVFYPFLVGKTIYAHILIEILFVLWLILILLDHSYIPRRSLILILFGGYLFISFISAIFGIDFRHSFWSDYQRMGGVWDLLHWFLFTLIAISILRGAREWRIILNLNLAVSMILSIIALIQTYNIPSPLPDFLYHTGRAYSTLGNPSYLAGILTINILVGIGLLFSSFINSHKIDSPTNRRKRPPKPTDFTKYWRLFWSLSIILGIWALLLTGTRGSLIGLFVGTGIFIVFLMAQDIKRFIIPIASSGLISLIIIGIIITGETTTSFSVIPSSSGTTTTARLLDTALEEKTVASRIELIKIGFRGMLSRPLLGWGPDNFPRVFDKFAEPKFYSLIARSQDRAHNKIIEELSTKGVLGTTVYLSLWFVLIWTVIKRKRDSKSGVIAFSIVGALIAYFVQNLFLFDTPTTMLQWVLLMAWIVTNNEMSNISLSSIRQSSKPTIPTIQQSNFVKEIFSETLTKWIISIILFILLVLSIYFLNYRPFKAAQLFDQAFYSSGQLENSLNIAEKSNKTFPSMSTMPIRRLLAKGNSLWSEMNIEEKQLIINFVVKEGEKALKISPTNPRLIATILPTLQDLAPSIKELNQLDPLLDKLKNNAPNRAYTIERLAYHELRKGNYHESLRMITEFKKKAPSDGRGERSVWPRFE